MARVAFPSASGISHHVLYSAKETNFMVSVTTQSSSSLDLAAIDMTLLLAADSFLRHRLPGGDDTPADPVGDQSLVNFIDLIVNSEACFLLLPSGGDYPTNLPLANRISALKRLRNSAIVHLNLTTERRVIREFKSLMSDYEFLSRWFKAHWGNPAIPRPQEPALGGLARRFATISEEGWESFTENFQKSQLKILEPLSPSMPKHSYLADDIRTAGGLVIFQYAYAFDMFRRGWQYAASSNYKNRGIWYCPHRIRQRALEAGSKSWLESNRSLFWSWGRCLVNLIESSSGSSEPERVADWINGIVEARPPKWLDVPDLIKSSAQTREAKIARRELIEMVESVAKSARIPRRLMKPTPFPFKLAKIAAGHIGEELRLGTIEGILQILPTKRALTRAQFYISETVKDAANFMYKGTFGYPGLISSSMRDSAAPPKQSEFLI
jgi:hypothetical protein